MNPNEMYRPPSRRWGKPRPHRKRKLLLAAALAAGLVGVVSLLPSLPVRNALGILKSATHRAPVDDRCADSLGENRLPAQFEVDPVLQAVAVKLVRKYPTRLAAAFAMDLSTRRPLAAVFGENGRDRVDLAALTAPRYPMASLAKMTTAWAAINERGFRPQTTLCLWGNAHTLYKGQLDTGRGIPVSLQRAFAYSINPIFGQIGVHYIGRDHYLRWLDTMGFNRPQGLGAGVPSGLAQEPKDDYGLAELASGFVRTTFVSPVHACMLVRRYAGGGKLLPPRWMPLPSGCRPSAPAPENQAVRSMLALMRFTADSGTAQRAFTQVWSDELRRGFEFGGKTGSLNGTDPRGYYEWFAGFARRAGRPDSGIAVAVLAVADGREELPGAWFGVQILGAWRRHLGEVRAPVRADVTDLEHYLGEEDVRSVSVRPTYRLVPHRVKAAPAGKKSARSGKSGKKRRR